MNFKKTPPVADSSFGIRTPGFIVIYGHVLHVIAAQYKHQRFLKAGHRVGYKRHGDFQVCCIHGGHAVIKHTTLSGGIMTLVVPDKQWLNVSNGSYRTMSPYYPSFESTYSFLATAQFVAEAKEKWINHPEDLTTRYHVLFDAFIGFWKQNFSESCQEDKDSGTFSLGAQIRYGMACAMNGKVIPADCAYEKLVQEVDQWIGYRDGIYD